MTMVPVRAKISKKAAPNAGKLEISMFTPHLVFVTPATRRRAAYPTLSAGDVRDDAKKVGLHGVG
ncbi:MAG: hypothetical protein WBD53_21275, partial [Xanthobacteraceae bacterium]